MSAVGREEEGQTPWIGPQGQVMRRLELHLTYTCPERCLFCSEEHRMQRFKRFPVTWGRVAKVLRTMAERGVQGVHLTGGEPTIHPRFIDVLKLSKKLGMRTSIGTIGTRLSKESFAREALPWLDEALFSLHGPNPEVHDRMAGREGSFERVTRAITLSRQLRPDFRPFVNTVVTRHNIEALPDTVALAARLGAQLIVVSNTTPEGLGSDRFDELSVPLSQMARVLPTVPERAGDAVLRFFGVPLCLLGEHWALSNDLHWDPRVTVEWEQVPGTVRFAGIYSWTPDRKREHVEACRGCARSALCMGVYDQTARDHDVSALTPFAGEGGVPPVTSGTITP